MLLIKSVSEFVTPVVYGLYSCKRSPARCHRAKRGTNLLPTSWLDRDSIYL